MRLSGDSPVILARRDDYRESRTRANERKTTQLCAQVERALDWAFEMDLDDPIFQELEVVDVQPNPGASHLLVLVGVPFGGDYTEADRALERASGILVDAVAQEITRRKVPRLTFGLVPL